MNKRFVSIVSALLLAAAPAIAAETMMEEGEYAGVRFDISSGYYYQSTDLKRLPKGAAVSVGANQSRITNLKGEVSEHGWFIAPRAGYYVPHSDTVTFGVEFEPEFMVSVSTDVKVTGDAKSALEGAIGSAVRNANASFAHINGASGVPGFLTRENLEADGNAAATTVQEERSISAKRAIVTAYGNTSVVAHSTSGDDTRAAIDALDTMARERFADEFVSAYHVELSNASNVNQQLIFANSLDTALDTPVADRIVPSLFAAAGTSVPSGAVSITNLDKSPTLFHVNLPVYAVAKFKSPQSSVRGHVGLGTGVMFYDMGDKVDGGASWPILAKAGFEVPVRPNIRVGGDARFHYALTTPSNVDSIWGIRVGARMTYFF